MYCIVRRIERIVVNLWFYHKIEEEEGKMFQVLVQVEKGMEGRFDSNVRFKNLILC